MIKTLLALLDRSARAPRKPAQAARHAPPGVPRRPPAADADFRAVVILSGPVCCQTVRDAAGQRHLMRAAPRLPLVGCDTPQQCTCRFKKIADRRDTDRRLLGGNATNRWYVGTEKRSRASRRCVPGY